MSFHVTVLGTGAAVPILTRGTSSHYVFVKNRSILIDCGEGTQVQLRKFKIKFQKISTILITHLHGDHVFGLPGLISTLLLLGRTQAISIIGPEGIKEFLLSQLKTVGIGKCFPIHFTELKKNTADFVFEDNQIKISAFPLNHGISTFGYRIDEKLGKRHLNAEAFEKTGVNVAYIQKLISGEDIVDNNGVKVNYLDVTFPPTPAKSYAFCSDTAFHLPLVEHIRNVDLLYHEATFAEKDIDKTIKTHHSTAKQAALIAANAHAKKLILGHFSARYKSLDQHLKEAKEIFEKTIIPKEGEKFYI